MKNAILLGVEIGAAFSAFVCLMAKDPLGALANIAFATYMRYARVVK